ncbi:hypothetical protein M5D96_006574, partial [Drosophila gunungcola]
HLRPLSYEEMCQMEMLQAAAGGPSASTVPPAMMPIMVIPTALLPAPISEAGAVGGGVPGAPTATTAGPGELALLAGEQIPHTIHHQHPQQMNILCTGTLGRQRMPAQNMNPNPNLNPNLNPNPNPSVSATLPRGFQPAAFDAVVGCGSLAYMMSSGTLGRGRRLAGGGQGKPKRVSFKGDNLPPPSPPPPPAVELDENGMPVPGPGDAGSCSYMHFDNYMDYQVNFGNPLAGGVVVGGDIVGLDAKSPTSLSSAAGAGASAKAKGKAARKANAGADGGQKGRRGSWLVALTLHFLMAPSRNSHAQRLRIVRRILREVPLVDGHNNYAWNVRKYAHSSLELHLSHDVDHKSLWARPAWAQTDMERLKQGLVSVQVSAYVPCEAQGLDAVQLALEQIDIVRRLSDMYARETVLATSSQDIVEAHRRGLLASLIGVEGGHTIGSSLGVLRSFYSLGARYLSLTHRCDVSWAGSSASSAEQGLTPFGKAIVREMNRLGMMIDLSHSSDATARDVLQVTRAPVIFSHSAARQLCNSTRNVPDDILRLVAENGGLIMLSFDSEDVACGRQARLQDVIEHIKYVRAIAGIQHIGLGAGYDGIELPPLGLEDVSKYPELLAALLEDHNWSEEDVAMLAGRNFLRIMETVETVRDYWKRAAIQPIEQTEPQPKTQCTYMSS